MSGQPAGRLTAIPAWVRYGVIAGILAFVCTVAANLIITVVQPAALCRAGPLIIPVSMLGALVVFLGLAAGAGFATGRAIGPGSTPALAGLLVGVLGGCALLALIPFAPGVDQRIRELMALCPDGGAFSLGASAPPPETLQPPPPEAVGPPTGVAGIFNAAVMITIGTGLAAGAAALAGVLGVATRSEPRPAHPR